MEASVLDVLVPLFEESGRSHVTIAEVTQAFNLKLGTEYDRPVTNRTVGGVIRRRLHLCVYKSHGIYVIPIAERHKVVELAIRFGIVDPVTLQR